MPMMVSKRLICFDIGVCLGLIPGLHGHANCSGELGAGDDAPFAIPKMPIIIIVTSGKNPADGEQNGGMDSTVGSF